VAFELVDELSRLGVPKTDRRIAVAVTSGEPASIG
jgi:hypothetical protein